MRDLGLESGSKPVVTPGVKDVLVEEAIDKVSVDATRFRALVARANYLAQYRADIQFAVKELCRKMSNPEMRDWVALKRLGRYLLGEPRKLLKFDFQEMTV